LARWTMRQSQMGNSIREDSLIYLMNRKKQRQTPVWDYNDRCCFLPSLRTSASTFPGSIEPRL
jgi:hypothetical protein